MTRPNFAITIIAPTVTLRAGPYAAAFAAAKTIAETIIENSLSGSLVRWHEPVTSGGVQIVTGTWTALSGTGIVTIEQV